MKNKILFIIILFSALISPKVNAQSYAFKQFKEMDGLINIDVRDLDEDEYGRIWFATKSGVSVFDGFDWTNYSSLKYESLDHAYRITSDDAGTKWVLSLKGTIRFSFLKENNWQTIISKEYDDDLRNFVDFIVVGDTNHFEIYFCSPESGLYHYNGTEWNLFQEEMKLDFNSAYSIKKEQKGILFSTDKGIYRYDKHGVKNISEGILPKKYLPVLGFDKDKSGKLWIVAKNSVGFIYDNKFQIITDELFFDHKIKNLRVLAEYKNLLLVSSSLDKVLINKLSGEVHHLNTNHGSSGDGAASAFIDRYLGLWFVGIRGVDYLKHPNMVSYNTTDGLLGREVSSILEHNKKKYIGHTNGISIIKNHSIKNFKLITNPVIYEGNYRVVDLTESNGSVWVAADKAGFGKIIGDRSIEWADGDFADGFSAYSLEEDKNGILYGLTGFNLFRYTGKSFSKIKIKNHTDVYFRKLFISPENEFYIATMDSGIARVKNNQLIYYNSRIDNQAKSTYCIQFEKPFILVGSSDGLYTLQSDSLKKDEKFNLPPHTAVYFILKPQEENYVFGTNKGIYIWKDNQLKNFDITDGLIGQETNRDAGFIGDDGNIWVGTENGLSVFSPKDEENYLSTPIIMLKESSYSDSSLEADGIHHLDYSQNSITFSFHAVIFSEYKSLQYRIKLHGYENQFKYLKSTQPVIHYTNLPPGEYQFEVSAREKNHPWGQIKQSSKIIVDKPYYAEYWFLVSIIFFLIFLAYIIVLLNNKIRATKELKAQVHIKSEALSESEKRYRQMFEGNHAPMLLIDPINGDILDANPSALNFYGFSYKDIWGSNINDIDINNNLKRMKSQSSGSPSKDHQFKTIHRLSDGNLRDVDVYVSLLNVKNSSILHLIIVDVTERTIFENALKSSEEKYRNLISNIQDGVFLLEGMVIKYVNNSFAKMIGYKPDEIIDQDFQQFIAPEDLAMVIDRHKRRMSGEQVPNEYEFKLLHKNKTKRIYINIHVGVFKNNNIQGSIGTVKDITEKKIRDEQLRILSISVEQSPNSVLITDTNGNIQYVNSAFELITGYREKEVIGKKPSILKPNDSDNEIYKNLWETITSDQVWRGELLNVNKFGKKYWVSAGISPIKNENGEVVNYIAFEEDITFEKYAREEINKNQKIINTVLKNTPIMLFAINMESKVVLIQGKILNDFNLNLENISGKDTDQIFRFMPEVKKQIKRALKGEEYSAVVEYKKKFFEVNYTPNYQDNDKLIGTIGVAYDLTDRYNTEIALEESKNEAEKSDRLKSEFLAQISHEIRTPINSILSFTSLLKSALYDSVEDDLKDSFQIIDNGGRRLIRTIDLVLNMSQIQSGTYEANYKQIDIHNDVLQPVITELSGSAKTKGLNLIYNIKAEDTRLTADAYTLTQVFVNLIDNAIKYTKKGKIEVKVYTKDEQLLVDVQDSGIGMTDEFQKNMFDPFTQEETGYTRKFEGSGLGLALVIKYIEVNKGIISVKSKKGVGTTFTIKFITSSNNSKKESFN